MKSLVFIAAFALVATAGYAQQRTLTTNGGVPVGNNQNSKTAGESGSVLLEDIHLIEKIAAFDRERIPERVVHARGVAAHGEFESYSNFASLTKAAFLGQKGKKTPVFLRFSTVIHPSGSPETARDPRGFAVKFYTEEGNYDIVGNNLPVFFIRDAIKFPDMVHSLKPSPITNKQDGNRFFDFFSHVPEATQMLTFLFSDHGIPKNYRETNGFGVHAFKWVNAQGEVRYVKYKWTSQQGEKNLTADEAKKIQGEDWQHATNDLYQSIYKGNYPAWELSVQIIKPEELDKFEFNPLDATKTWPEDLVPSVKIGKMILNRMPDNFFEETEQSAFAPGNLVPGIEASEDRLLQGRLFSYFDTQRYRMGSNFQQLPINRPKVAVNTYNQDGALTNRGAKGDVNYQPSVTGDSYKDNPSYEYARTPLKGTTLQRAITKTLNFKQAGDLYRSFTEKEKASLIRNLSGELAGVKNKGVQRKMVGYFYKADKDYGTRLSKALGIDAVEIERLIQDLALAD
ncbi:MAG: catalase [Rhizobacter sp.]|nr:catalase [Chlorobiales bacterium]